MTTEEILDFEADEHLVRMGDIESGVNVAGDERAVGRGKRGIDAHSDGMQKVAFPGVVLADNASSRLGLAQYSGVRMSGNA